VHVQQVVGRLRLLGGQRLLARVYHLQPPFDCCFVIVWCVYVCMGGRRTPHTASSQGLQCYQGLCGHLSASSH